MGTRGKVKRFGLERIRLVEEFSIIEAQRVIKSLEKDLPDNFISGEEPDGKDIDVTYDNGAIVFYPYKNSNVIFHVPEGVVSFSQDGVKFVYKNQEYIITPFRDE
jgi:hypothetical protein